LNLARGLAGDMMKRILFGLGGTNSGKSILTTAVTLSCGDYIGSFNAENLAYRNTSNDEAQIMRWAMLLRFKRIIFSNEMKSTVELNGNMIKKISSGGDTLIGRNHCKSEEEFITHLLPVCLANDIPNIKPYDDAVDGRTRVISYKKEFVDEPMNELELKKDANIEIELKTLKFQKAFVGLLIHQYTCYNHNIEPIDVINAKKEWINEDKGIVETFKRDFEITNNENDFVTSNNIEEWINSKKLGISMKKFGMEMKKYITIHKLDNVENKVKKINGKGVQAWFGIQKILEDTENIE
jgi:phage/plasmid-associated DNA primase